MTLMPPPDITEQQKVGPNRWVSRITDDWLPFPAEALEQLGWKEGDELELIPLAADNVVKQMLVRKKDAGS